MTDQPYTGGPDAPTPAAVDPAPVKTAVTLSSPGRPSPSWASW